MKTIRISLITVLSGVLLIGCASPRQVQSKQTLNEGYAALEQHRYDEAARNATSFLDAQPAGPGSAEAWYLKGRAAEQSVTDVNAHPTDAQARSSLQAARVSYINVLKLSPSPKLEAYTRASLANVAYFQDDYQTAMGQWLAAIPKLDQPELKAWSLYRVGLCQQRLGQFAGADQTFTQVSQQFPNTEPANRAASKKGATAFYVQVATFRNAGNADRAIAAMKKQGVTATRADAGGGLQQVRIGPMKSYAEAKNMKTRFANDYPEALIIP